MNGYDCASMSRTFLNYGANQNKNKTVGKGVRHQRDASVSMITVETFGQPEWRLVLGVHSWHRNVRESAVLNCTKLHAVEFRERDENLLYCTKLH